MNETIDPDLLEKYVNTVCRFGRAEAPYWFVGLEEGGEKSCVEISKRLQRWENEGFPDTRYLKNGGSPKSDPVYKYLPGIGKRAHLQMTWSNQLRLVLGIEGRELDNEVIREMQVSEHGTEGGDTSLLELFPLPCRKAGSWIYKSCGLGEGYASKSIYQKRLLIPRLRQIFESVREHKPAVIVFTTLKQKKAIKNHVPSLKKHFSGTGKTKGEALIGSFEETAVVVCTHPGYRFSDKNKFYWNLGQKVRPLIDEARLPKK